MHQRAAGLWRLSGQLALHISLRRRERPWQDPLPSRCCVAHAVAAEGGRRVHPGQFADIQLFRDREEMPPPTSALLGLTLGPTCTHLIGLLICVIAASFPGLS